MILTVTRACNCRCSYCPSAHDDGAALSVSQVQDALQLHRGRYGGGVVKLTGGEPLLEPEVVGAVLDDVAKRDEVSRVLLCTNGLALTREWLRRLSEHDKAVVLLSLDGKREDYRRHRHSVADEAEPYDHLMALLPELKRARRLIVTQTIAPDTAARTLDNFAHLLSLGFWRFKFLPVYYRSWTSQQIAALRAGFGGVAARIKARWQQGEPLYVRNLFTWAPTPLFNTGVVVDVDGAIYASNVGLASACSALQARTRVGSLADPPSLEQLQSAAAEVRDSLCEALPASVWQSTMAVDDELTHFCHSLYPDYLAFRKRRRGEA